MSDEPADNFDHTVSGNPPRADVDWADVVDQALSVAPESAPAEPGEKVTPMPQPQPVIPALVAQLQSLPFQDGDAVLRRPMATYTVPEVDGFGITITTLRNGGLGLIFSRDGHPVLTICQSLDVAGQFSSVLQGAVELAAYWDDKADSEGWE